MSYKKSCVLILLLLILPLAIADTLITFKTLSNHRLSLVIREEGKLTSFESFHKDTGGGEVSFTTSFNQAYFDLIATLKKDGNQIINKKFESVKTGEPIIINFIPGNVSLMLASEISKTTNNETINDTSQNDTTQNKTDIVNNTSNSDTIAETNITENTTEKEKSKKITGFITKGKETILSKKILYFIGVILVLFILTLITFYIRKKIKKAYTSFKVRPLSEIKSSNFNKRIENAEKKIQEAQREIEEIKNKERRLKEAEERFKKDKKELRLLESEF